MSSSVKPRAFDLVASFEEMEDFKWGLFYIIKHRAEQYKKYEAKANCVEFREKNVRALSNHEWFCTCLDYSKHNHDRLWVELKEIFGRK